MNTTGALMGETVGALKNGKDFKFDRALGMHPTERQTDVASELGIENPLAAFLVNVGSDPSSFLGAGAIRNTVKGASKSTIKNNVTLDKFKRFLDRAAEDKRKQKLPISTSKSINELASENTKRFKTPEGVKRLKEMGSTKDLNALRIVDDKTTAGYSQYNNIASNSNLDKYNLKLNRAIFDHELQHFVSPGKNNPINESLRKLDFLKKTKQNEIDIDNLRSNKGKPEEIYTIDDVKYFKKSGDKQLQSDYFKYRDEPAAHLAEARRKFLDSGEMKDAYEKVTPEKIKELYIKNRFNDSGIRLFNIIKPTASNFKIIADNMNKLPAVTGAIGAAAALNNKEEMALGGAPQYQSGRETSEDSPISAFLNKTQDNVNDWLGDTMNPKDINKLFDLDLMGQMKILEDEYAKIWDSVNDELGQPENESAINNDPRVNDAWLRMNSFRDANPEVLQYEQAEDPLRHAISSANTSRAIQQKVKNTPYIGGLLDYIGADKAAGFVGSNLAGIGHEAMTILNDDRDWKDKGKESWEDIYNNFQGSLIGAQDISQEEIANKAFELYNAKKLKEGIVYQQGGQPTAQEGNGEYVLNNLQDFTITQQELDYLNDKDNNYCPGGNCLENTKNAFNKTAGTIPGVKDYYETWEKDLQATSQKNKPTQEQIEEMPWYKGDGNVASVDSWDVQGKIVDSGGTTVYNKNNSDSTYTPGKAAIGSIYSFGPSSRKDSGNKKRNQGYSKEFNLQPSHHSVSVVGFDDESNENILYDAYFREYLNESELIKKWEDHGLNYELEAIGTPKNYTGLTRENLKGNKYLKQDKTVRPYELDLKKLQSLTEDNEVQYTERDSDGNVSSRQPRFNSLAMKPFVNSLKKNKGVLMDVLNIGNSQYDELANLAVALAMGESEGGAGLSLDFLGETQGLTQLNYENISKDEVLNKSLKKINSKLDKKERITDIGSLRNPSKSAIASLLYLSKVTSRSKQAHEQGLNPSERTFYDNSNSLKETFRYSSAKINKDSFYVDAIGERIPFKDIPGWDNKDTKEVTNYLNTVSKSNDYIAKLDDKGKIAVTMKTKGNSPNLSLGKRIGYFWQSPNSLKTGDAQGGNVHASRIDHYFNSINNLQSGDLIKSQLGNGEYKVSSGDTFYGIANKNNVTWDELKKANPNIGYNNLKLNQSIVIPKKIDKSADVSKLETVKESVQDFQITPQLLYKQAYIESNLNPKAKNSLGYMGLGQIGKSLINDYKKANKVDTVDPFDPKQNYDVQAWSMNELFNSSFIDKPGSTMENRLLKSLASYNWGRGNVLNLLKAQKAKGSDIYNSTEWMQHLPKETKEYIQMIVYDGKPEKRPFVQENFLKTTTDEKYKDLRALYNYKQGGEPNLFNMYSGYINGDYDGTEFESKAALTYDKLNRVYYKEAKDAGMHVPNYIMTYVIGNS